ncbi:hypothetical protein C7974DRAFT_313354, partial [Boeremia exigua]|uniref:uncharacterized protein n=1 Tax=Boeremia exigua TaxID=749465 RepID=UPI001E8E25BF
LSNVDILKIKYWADNASVRELIPGQLSLEKQQIITTYVLHYGFTGIGSYKELIHQVEGTFQGGNYEYALLLVVYNEDASGYPKVLGDIDIDVSKRTGVTSFITATVSRTDNNPIIENLIKPSNFVGSGPIPPPDRVVLNIIARVKPNVCHFIRITFKVNVGER